MLNVETKIEGTKPHLIVDLEQTHGPSASGKTIIVASTQGNVKIGPVTVGLNVYKRPGDL